MSLLNPFRYLLIVLISFLGFSCGLLEKAIEKPEVNIETVQIKDVSGSGATLVFGLKVDNPNPFAIKVDGLKYDIQIGERKISEGSINTPTEVLARQSSIVQIPVPVKYKDIVASISDLLELGARPYAIDGSVQLGLISIPFKHSGEIKF